MGQGQTRQHGAKANPPDHDHSGNGPCPACLPENLTTFESETDRFNAKLFQLLQESNAIELSHWLEDYVVIGEDMPDLSALDPDTPLGRIAGKLREKLRSEEADPLLSGKAEGAEAEAEDGEVSPMKRQLSLLLQDSASTEHPAASDLTRSISEPAEFATGVASSNSSDHSKLKADIRTRLASANADPKNHTVAFNKADHSVTLIPAAAEIGGDNELADGRDTSVFGTAAAGSLFVSPHSKHDEKHSTQVDLDQNNESKDASNEGQSELHEGEDIRDGAHNLDSLAPVLTNHSSDNSSHISSESPGTAQAGDDSDKLLPDKESGFPIPPSEKQHIEDTNDMDLVTPVDKSDDTNVTLNDLHSSQDLESPGSSDTSSVDDSSVCTEKHLPLHDADSLQGELHISDTETQEDVHSNDHGVHSTDTPRQTQVLLQDSSSLLINGNGATDDSVDTNVAVLDDVRSHNQRNLEIQPEFQANENSVQGLVGFDSSVDEKTSDHDVGGEMPSTDLSDSDHKDATAVGRKFGHRRQLSQSGIDITKPEGVVITQHDVDSESAHQSLLSSPEFRYDLADHTPVSSYMKGEHQYPSNSASTRTSQLDDLTEVSSSVEDLEREESKVLENNDPQTGERAQKLHKLFRLLQTSVSQDDLEKNVNNSDMDIAEGHVFEASTFSEEDLVEHTRPGKRPPPPNSRRPRSKTSKSTSSIPDDVEDSCLSDYSAFLPSVSAHKTSSVSDNIREDGTENDSIPSHMVVEQLNKEDEYFYSSQASQLGVVKDEDVSESVNHKTIAKGPGSVDMLSSDYNTETTLMKLQESKIPENSSLPELLVVQEWNRSSDQMELDTQSTNGMPVSRSVDALDDGSHGPFSPIQKSRSVETHSMPELLKSLEGDGEQSNEKPEHEDAARRKKKISIKAIKEKLFSFGRSKDKSSKPDVEDVDTATSVGGQNGGMDDALPLHTSISDNIIDAETIQEVSFVQTNETVDSNEADRASEQIPGGDGVGRVFMNKTLSVVLFEEDTMRLISDDDDDLSVDGYTPAIADGSSLLRQQECIESTITKEHILYARDIIPPAFEPEIIKETICYPDDIIPPGGQTSVDDVSVEEHSNVEHKHPTHSRPSSVETKMDETTIYYPDNIIPWLHGESGKLEIEEQSSQVPCIARAPAHSEPGTGRHTTDMENANGTDGPSAELSSSDEKQLNDPWCEIGQRFPQSDSVVLTDLAKTTPSNETLLFDQCNLIPLDAWPEQYNDSLMEDLVDAKSRDQAVCTVNEASSLEEGNLIPLDTCSEQYSDNLISDLFGTEGEDHLRCAIIHEPVPHDGISSGLDFVQDTKNGTGVQKLVAVPMNIEMRSDDQKFLGTVGSGKPIDSSLHPNSSSAEPEQALNNVVIAPTQSTGFEEENTLPGCVLKNEESKDAPQPVCEQEENKEGQLKNKSGEAFDEWELNDDPGVQSEEDSDDALFLSHNSMRLEDPGPQPPLSFVNPLSPVTEFGTARPDGHNHEAFTFPEINMKKHQNPPMSLELDTDNHDIEKSHGGGLSPVLEVSTPMQEGLLQSVEATDVFNFHMPPNCVDSPGNYEANNITDTGDEYTHLFLDGVNADLQVGPGTNSSGHKAAGDSLMAGEEDATGDEVAPNKMGVKDEPSSDTVVALSGTEQLKGEESSELAEISDGTRKELTEEEDSKLKLIISKIKNRFPFFKKKPSDAEIGDEEYQDSHDTDRLPGNTVEDSIQAVIIEHLEDTEKNADSHPTDKQPSSPGAVEREDISKESVKIRSRTSSMRGSRRSSRRSSFVKEPGRIYTVTPDGKQVKLTNTDGSEITYKVSSDGSFAPFRVGPDDQDIIFKEGQNGKLLPYVLNPESQLVPSKLSPDGQAATFRVPTMDTKAHFKIGPKGDLLPYKYSAPQPLPGVGIPGLEIAYKVTGDGQLTPFAISNDGDLMPCNISLEDEKVAYKVDDQGRMIPVIELSGQFVCCLLGPTGKELPLGLGPSDTKISYVVSCDGLLVAADNQILLKLGRFDQHGNEVIYKISKHGILFPFVVDVNGLFSSCIIANDEVISQKLEADSTDISYKVSPAGYLQSYIISPQGNLMPCTAGENGQGITFSVGPLGEPVDYQVGFHGQLTPVDPDTDETIMPQIYTAKGQEIAYKVHPNGYLDPSVSLPSGDSIPCRMRPDGQLLADLIEYDSPEVVYKVDIDGQLHPFIYDETGQLSLASVGYEGQCVAFHIDSNGMPQEYVILSTGNLAPNDFKKSKLVTTDGDPDGQKIVYRVGPNSSLVPYILDDEGHVIACKCGYDGKFIPCFAEPYSADVTYKFTREEELVPFIDGPKGQLMPCPVGHEGEEVTFRLGQDGESVLFSIGANGSIVSHQQVDDELIAFHDGPRSHEVVYKVGPDSSLQPMLLAPDGTLTLCKMKADGSVTPHPLEYNSPEVTYTVGQLGYLIPFMDGPKGQLIPCKVGFSKQVVELISFPAEEKVVYEVDFDGLLKPYTYSCDNYLMQYRSDANGQELVYKVDDNNKLIPFVRNVEGHLLPCRVGADKKIKPEKISAESSAVTYKVGHGGHLLPFMDGPQGQLMPCYIFEDKWEITLKVGPKDDLVKFNVGADGQLVPCDVVQARQRLGSWVGPEGQQIAFKVGPQGQLVPYILEVGQPLIPCTTNLDGTLDTKNIHPSHKDVTYKVGSKGQLIPLVDGPQGQLIPCRVGSEGQQVQFCLSSDTGHDNFTVDANCHIVPDDEVVGSELKSFIFGVSYLDVAFKVGPDDELVPYVISPNGYLLPCYHLSDDSIASYKVDPQGADVTYKVNAEGQLQPYISGPQKQLVACEIASQEGETFIFKAGPKKDDISFYPGSSSKLFPQNKRASQRLLPYTVKPDDQEVVYKVGLGASLVPYMNTPDDLLVPCIHGNDGKLMPYKVAPSAAEITYTFMDGVLVPHLDGPKGQLMPCKIGSTGQTVTFMCNEKSVSFRINPHGNLQPECDSTLQQLCSFKASDDQQVAFKVGDSDVLVPYLVDQTGALLLCTIDTNGQYLVPFQVDPHGMEVTYLVDHNGYLVPNIAGPKYQMLPCKVAERGQQINFRAGPRKQQIMFIGTSSHQLVPGDGKVSGRLLASGTGPDKQKIAYKVAADTLLVPYIVDEEGSLVPCKAGPKGTYRRVELLPDGSNIIYKKGEDRNLVPHIEGPQGQLMQCHILHDGQEVVLRLGPDEELQPFFVNIDGHLEAADDETSKYLSWTGPNDESIVFRVGSRKQLKPYVIEVDGRLVLAKFGSEGIEYGSNELNDSMESKDSNGKEAMFAARSPREDWINRNKDPFSFPKEKSSKLVSERLPMNKSRIESSSARKRSRSRHSSLSKDSEDESSDSNKVASTTRRRHFIYSRENSREDTAYDRKIPVHRTGSHERWSSLERRNSQERGRIRERPSNLDMKDNIKLQQSAQYQTKPLKSRGKLASADSGIGIPNPEESPIFDSIGSSPFGNRISQEGLPASIEEVWMEPNENAMPASDVEVQRTSCGHEKLSPDELADLQDVWDEKTGQNDGPFAASPEFFTSRWRFKPSDNLSDTASFDMEHSWHSGDGSLPGDVTLPGDMQAEFEDDYDAIRSGKQDSFETRDYEVREHSALSDVSSQGTFSHVDDKLNEEIRELEKEVLGATEQEYQAATLQRLPQKPRGRILSESSGDLPKRSGIPRMRRPQRRQRSYSADTRPELDVTLETDEDTKPTSTAQDMFDTGDSNMIEATADWILAADDHDPFEEEGNAEVQLETVTLKKNQLKIRWMMPRDETKPEVHEQKAADEGVVEQDNELASQKSADASRPSRTITVSSTKKKLMRAKQGATQFDKSFNCVPDPDSYEPDSDMAQLARKMRKMLSEAEPVSALHGQPNYDSISSKVTLQSMGLHIGDKVIVGGVKTGILRFSGPTEFAPGVWAGIELDDAVGKNDGTVGGVSYFKCPPKHGIFAPISKISRPGILSNRPTSANKSPTKGPIGHGNIDTSHVTAKVDTGRYMRWPRYRSNPQLTHSPCDYGRVDTSHVTAKVNTGLSRRSSGRSSGMPDGETLPIGDRVLVAGQRRGVIRYSGETDFAPGWWYGIELDRPVGKNDGSVNNRRYFTCKPKFGVFAPPSRAQRIDDSMGEDTFDLMSTSMDERQHKLSDLSPSPPDSDDQEGVGGSQPILYGSPGRPKSALVRPKSSGSSGSLRRSLSVSGGSEFKLQEGMSVFCNNELGTLRYIGTVEFAEGIWLGVELRTPKGKNDGSVQGHRYFTCKPNYGLIVRPSKVTVRGINGAKLLGDNVDKL